MNKVILAGALALALSACAAVTDKINAFDAWLASPTTTQAAANLKSMTTSLTCQVASVSALTAQITKAVAAKETVAIRDAQNVCVVSSALCNALGGAAVASACTGSLPPS